MRSFNRKLLVTVAEFGVLTDGAEILIKYVVVITRR